MDWEGLPRDARRLRDGLDYVRIMFGSAPYWNWQFQLRFHNFKLQFLKEVLQENFAVTELQTKAN